MGRAKNQLAATTSADPFRNVFANFRSRGSILVSDPDEQDRFELERVLQQVHRDDFTDAQELLQRARGELPPLGEELLVGVAAHIAQRVIVPTKNATQDYMMSTLVDGRSNHILRQQEKLAPSREATPMRLHLARNPLDRRHPDFSRLDIVCGLDMSKPGVMSLQPAPLGAWQDRQSDNAQTVHYRQCPRCAEAQNEFGECADETLTVIPADDWRTLVHGYENELSDLLRSASEHGYVDAWQLWAEKPALQLWREHQAGYVARRLWSAPDSDLDRVLGNAQSSYAQRHAAKRSVDGPVMQQLSVDEWHKLVRLRLPPLYGRKRPVEGSWLAAAEKRRQKFHIAAAEALSERMHQPASLPGLEGAN